MLAKYEPVVSHCPICVQKQNNRAMAATATIGGGAASVSGGADSCGDSDRSVDRHLRCLHSRTTRMLSEVVAMYRMLSADANGIPLQAPWSGGSQGYAKRARQ